LQRNYKISFIKLFSFAIIVNCFLFDDVKAQNADINTLRKISNSRNLKYEKLQSGISFSVYPALALTPASIATIGLVNKDTNTVYAGICIATGIALNTAMAIGLKYAINRDRPYITYPEIKNLANETTPAMPSGHTSSAFNVATSLTLFYPKWYVAVPAYTWASGVAYSRMYLGVHYPSDLIAGAILGSGTAWLTYYLNRKWFRKRSTK
jgi:membrane-associated phospholipid phosphatase